MAIYQIKVETILTVEADSKDEALREYRKENYDIEYESVKSVHGPIQNNKKGV